MMRTFRLCLLLSLGCILTLSSLCAQPFFYGYALYNELNRNTTYLIDENRNIAHSWQLPTSCNYTVLLKENGNIIRGAVNPGNTIQGPAVGGMVQEWDPQGNLVWEFVYSSSNYVAHHDMTLMPNGGVMLIAWEVKTNAEMQALGYTGSGVKYATHFIEVQQDGTGGKIVWEWHVIDHLIQDVDPSKPNYGVIADHPERLNVNVPTGGFGGGGGFGGDWLHVNGIDYNEELDQIVFSSRFLSEIFIIDHSTTTAEAATNSGGNSGKGGDFLYRWGNPLNYNTPGIKTIGGAVHDSRWITNDGRPNAGYIQIFNNVGGTNGGSAVDAIETPWNGTSYDRTPGMAYAPLFHSWRHDCIDNANGQSASNRLSNGNTFVALSGQYMYEVDANDNLVWQYNAGPAKAFRYECNYPGIQNLLSNPCTQPGVGISDLEASEIRIFPNPTSGVFAIENIPQQMGPYEVEVMDIAGRVIFADENPARIDLSDQPAGLFIVRIMAEGAPVTTRKITLQK